MFEREREKREMEIKYRIDFLYFINFLICLVQKKVTGQSPAQSACLETAHQGP